MTYKQEAEESLDDFVNRCRRMTQRCSLTEHELQPRLIELIIAITPIADFLKELLRKDNTLTREHKKPKPHYQPQYRRKQYMKTDTVYNNKEAEEQMESLTFNCINMTQRDEAFVLINIKLPNRNGILKLRLKIDTGAQRNTQPVSTFRRMFPEKLDADGFPNIKRNQFITPI